MVSEIDSTDKITVPRISIGFLVYKAEEIIKILGLDFLIFRTDQPYCWTEKWQHLNSVVRVVKTLSKSNVFGFDKKMIRPISSEILNLPAKRPNVNLSNQKVFKKTGVGMIGIKE